jgi:hypothetical protein
MLGASVRDWRVQREGSHSVSQSKKSVVKVILVCAVVATLGSVVTRSAAATPAQVNSNVLLIGSGGSDPTTGAWQSALSAEGVAYTFVTATGPYGAETVTLPALTAGAVGNFSGVVLAGSPTAFAYGQLAALDTYESTFGVRQVDGYMYPSQDLGLTYVSGGALDNTTAQLTPAGLAALPGQTGPVRFDAGTYGYPATVVPGAPFTPWLEQADGNVLAGVYQHPITDAQAGVSELTLTFDYNATQHQWLLLAPGLIDWVTQTTQTSLPPNQGSLTRPVVGIAAMPKGDGYWLANATGDVSAHGSAQNYGSLAGKPLNAPIAHIVATRDGKGYWLVAADGGVFSFGDANFFGSMGGQHLNAPVVSLSPSADDQGYWLVASDGGVFAFGDAGFFGSMGGKHLNRPIVGIAADTSTGGYWLVASDGGIFAFGAPFLGSTGYFSLNKPINGMAVGAGNQGYWLVASDGGVFAFGDAGYFGSMGGQHLNQPIVGIAADNTTYGYWLVASDGGLFAFGAPFYGPD